MLAFHLLSRSFLGVSGGRLPVVQGGLYEIILLNVIVAY